MFRKLFGNKKERKKRLSPSARTPEGLVQSHPMYQYALNEYAQTVAPATSNDDGMSVFSGQGDEFEGTNSDPGLVNLPQPPSNVSNLRARSPSEQAAASPASPQSVPVPTSPKPEYVFKEAASPPATPQNNQTQQMYGIPSRYPLNEPTMPDATYEEYYGDAYIGGPTKYIYPSGYQSMRPRGGPWKLSIVVCVLFTWMSIFIIGHCSDRVDQSLYDQTEIDDDTLVLETRWCGSGVLYMMWVISMLITGIATAYCSVIGYIKLRDFVVANSRSQPPGMLGKSDYYVQITDSQQGEGEGYQKTIYQADGTPQFWGGHIYRPTQAAVAITSR